VSLVRDNPLALAIGRHQHPLRQFRVGVATFQRLWPYYWTEEERGEFAAWLAENPEAGDIVPSSGGCRKVRWARAGSCTSASIALEDLRRIIDSLEPSDSDLILRKGSRNEPAGRQKKHDLLHRRRVAGSVDGVFLLE
jgi:hypothetical protein